MLAFLLSMVYCGACLLYIAWLVGRFWWRFGSGQKRGAFLLAAGAIFFTLFFHLLFVTWWNWAEKNNQLGEHFWASVAYVVIFAGMLWLIRRMLYVLPKKRLSHRQQAKPIRYSYHPEAEVLKKAQRLGKDLH